MITLKDFLKDRDEKIFQASKTKSHKAIAAEFYLSPSRVKAICVEQRKISKEKVLIIFKGEMKCKNITGRKKN